MGQNDVARVPLAGGRKGGKVKTLCTFQLIEFPTDCLLKGMSSAPVHHQWWNIQGAWL